MSDSADNKHSIGPLAKLLGLGLFALFLGLGLIGLVLPIIPGIVFLLLALYVLTRISGRFASLANRHSWIRKSFRRLGHVRTLPAVDVIKLSFWVTARGIVNGAAAIARKISGAGATETARGGS
ncbi:MAG: DUF454 family protein [Gammaproteobacteria bacterium]|nr:DUF454 family protein [Gammaproteobacteria bacterium]